MAKATEASNASFVQSKETSAGNFICTISVTATKQVAGIGPVASKTWYFVELTEKPEHGPIKGFDILKLETRVSHYTDANDQPQSSTWIIG